MAKKKKTTKKKKASSVRKETSEDKDVFYVGIKDPIEIRRSILESSKEVIQYLQRAEKFKQVRNEKAEEIAKLRGIMAETTKLVNKLKKQLPKAGIRTPLHRHEEAVMKEALVKELKEAKQEFAKSTESTAPKVVEKKVVAKPKKVSELEKLESELNAIESKLSDFA